MTIDIVVVRGLRPLFKGLMWAAALALFLAHVLSGFGASGQAAGWVVGAVIGLAAGPFMPLLLRARAERFKGQTLRAYAENLSDARFPIAVLGGVLIFTFLWPAISLIVMALIAAPWGDATHLGAQFGAYLMAASVGIGIVNGLAVGVPLQWYLARLRRRRQQGAG